MICLRSNVVMSKPSCYASQPNVISQAENDCGRCPFNGTCITGTKTERSAELERLRDDLKTAYELCSGPVGFQNGWDARDKLIDIKDLEKRLTRIRHELKTAEAGFAAKGYGNAALSEAILLLEETKGTLLK